MRTTVRTYEDLAKYTVAFAKGGYNLLFLIGNPGQSKSRTLKENMSRGGKKKLWIEGSVSAFQLYQELWNFKDVPVVLDDVDSIYTDRNLVRLLKCLCNTEAEKIVSWNTSARQLDANGIDRSFVTRSKVCIIANHWQTLTQHVGSLNDRGLMIQFDPSAEEIHKKAKTFFKDKEILEFIGTLIPCLESEHFAGTHSLRHYINSLELKTAGLDWQKVLLETFGLYEVFALQNILEKKNPLNEQNVMEFQKVTGLSRPKYFDAHRMYKELQSVLPKWPKPKPKAKSRTKLAVVTAS